MSPDNQMNLPPQRRFGRALTLLLIAVLTGGAAAAALAQPPHLTLPSSGESAVVPVAVFGEDDRHELPDNQAPLADAIGVLTLGGQPFCTAFCVGPQTIATASHCLLGTEQVPGPDLERVAFKVGQRLPQSAPLAGSTRFEIRSNLRSGTPQLRVTPPIAAARDWAIAPLAAPVCSAVLPLSPLSREAVEHAAANGEIYQVAMHRDLSTPDLVLARPCAIPTALPQVGPQSVAMDFLEPRAIFMHTCDTGPGSSGSPLLRDGPGGPEVIGINVGTYVLAKPITQPSSAMSANKASSKTETSQAIANTAISTERLRSTVDQFNLGLERAQQAARAAHTR